MQLSLEVILSYTLLTTNFPNCLAILIGIAKVLLQYMMMDYFCVRCVEALQWLDGAIVTIVV